MSERIPCTEQLGGLTVHGVATDVTQHACTACHGAIWANLIWVYHCLVLLEWVFGVLSLRRYLWITFLYLVENFTPKCTDFQSLNRKNVNEVVLFCFFFHWTQFNLKKCPMVKHIILPRKRYRWFLSVVYLYQNVLSRKDSVKPCRSHPFEGSCLSSGMCRCHHSREMGLFADPCLVRHQQQRSCSALVEISNLQFGKKNRANWVNIHKHIVKKEKQNRMNQSLILQLV